MSAKQQKGLRRTVPILAVAALLMVLGAILAGCTVVASAPDVTRLEWDSSTVIYDRKGSEAFRLHSGENRTPVKLSQIPKQVQQAFLAIEDPDFREHGGIDLRGLARAAFRSTLYLAHLPGGRLEGGSTITQQLARDAWLSQDVTLKRKLQEAWVALQLERHYTKDEILEMYLNQIYFGHGAYGIDAAAKTFFAKEVSDLSVAEAAQLAGMINGPSYFDPYEHPDDSLQRRNIVLNAMLKEGYLTREAYDSAHAEKPRLGSKQRAADMAGGHFIDYVISVLQDAKPGLAAQYGIKLSDKDNVAKAGLKVYTTLDSRLQGLAEQALTEQMARADQEYNLPAKGPLPQAAMLVMDPHTGEILAMVGGREHRGLLEFNRATDAYRQPGSAIKPLVAYIPALNAGLSPATILDDAPVMLSNDGKTVWPQNYDFKYLGLKSMRYGVEQSLNPIAVRALQAAGGPARAAEFARGMGLTTIGREDESLALALGGLTKGTTVMDMTVAYSAIANMGVKVDPVLITKIVDRDGQTLFEARPHKRQVVRAAVDYLMLDMLKGVVRRGTAYGFTGGFHGWPAAGKTGTTEDNRDAWFVGFTPDLVATVWNGYDNPENHLQWTGAFVPVKIWTQFMNGAVTKPSADWPRPADVISAPVCRQTGMLPSDLCAPDQVGSDLFLAGTEPRTAGDLLVKAQAIAVRMQTPDKKGTYTQWQLWQPGCSGAPVERVFIKRPQPRVTHPTDPYNPRYVPQDAKDELPTAVCQRTSIWERLFPKWPPDAPGVPGLSETPGVSPAEPSPP